MKTSSHAATNGASTATADIAPTVAAEEPPVTPPPGPGSRTATILGAVGAIAGLAAGFIPLAPVRMGLAVLGSVLIALALRSFLQRDRATAAQVANYVSEGESRSTQLAQATNDAIESRAATELLLKTVSQGLFTMGPDFKVIGPTSKALETIFRVAEIRGLNVLNLLQRLLTDRTFSTTRTYFNLLFDKSKKERTVLSVNPLQSVEVNFANNEGGYETRYLCFAFQRIYNGDEIARVFVAVSDITEQVELEHKLRATESAKERQFEFLLGVMHVAPTELEEFIETLREQLAVMNSSLRTQDFAAATAGQISMLRQRLETVARSVQTVKEAAEKLKFNHFVNFCNQFETKLTSLRNKGTLSGDDFLTVVLQQSELAEDIEELAEVRARFVAVSAAQSGGRERRATDMITSVANLISRLADNQGKKARFEAIGFETARMSDDTRRSVKDVLIQFARNAVTYGVETPDERFQLGKVPVATISVTAKIDEAAQTFNFTFRDDGRGLVPDALKAHAVASGIISPEQAAAMPKGAAIGLIFRPGFSTATEVTEESGRGFGLNIVKEIVVDRLGGKLNLRSEPERFTEFIVTIPLTPATAPADDRRRDEVPA
jgi:signal transduction histidine kinase